MWDASNHHNKKVKWSQQANAQLSCYFICGYRYVLSADCVSLGCSFISFFPKPFPSRRVRILCRGLISRDSFYAYCVRPVRLPG